MLNITEDCSRISPDELASRDPECRGTETKILVMTTETIITLSQLVGTILLSNEQDITLYLTLMF